MIKKTYFLIMSDDSVIRQEVIKSSRIWHDMSMQLAAQANVIVELSPYGRGKSIKNRFSEKPQYFSRDEMTMLALRSENV